MIGQYRHHRLIEHGGGIDGFQTECMLLPDDGICVAVMTNTSSSAMAPVVAYRVLDELLGLDALDWFSSFKPRFDAAMAGIREARTEADRQVTSAEADRDQALTRAEQAGQAARLAQQDTARAQAAADAAQAETGRVRADADCRVPGAARRA